jgi:hypothetical protein
MSTGRFESKPPTSTLLEAVWCKAGGEYGLSYQSCRFCKSSWPNVTGLWKYAVRHYICDECRGKTLEARKVAIV